MRKKQSMARRGWVLLGLLAVFLLGMGQPVYQTGAGLRSAPIFISLITTILGNGVAGGQDVIIGIFARCQRNFPNLCLEGLAPQLLYLPT